MPTLPTCLRCGREHVAPNGVSPACTGHKADGSPCKQPRPRGGTVCRYHGGAAPQIKAKAAQRVAEAKAREELYRLGHPVEINPAQALLEQVRWSAGHVLFLRAKVEELFGDDHNSLVWGETRSIEKGAGKHPGTDTTEEAGVSIWWKLYSEERERLVAVSAAALRAGVEERRVRLAEQQGNAVGDALKAIFAELQLSPKQWELVPKVVPLHLRALTGGAA